MQETEKTAFVAQQMGISVSRAAELIGCAQETIDEILAGDYPEESPDQQAALVQQQAQVQLPVIAGRIDADVGQLSSWTEDEMVWILYGSNIAEGIAGSGRDCAEATANFYARWYDEFVAKKAS